MTAFNYLNELDKRFSGGADSVLVASQSTMRTLHFRVGRYDLLLPLDNSTEVISDIHFSPIPISRPWVLGVASRRGQLLSLIDLKNFLFNTEPLNKIAGRRVITTKVGSVFFGFVVDHVAGLMNLQPEAFKDSYPDNWDASLVDYLSGIYMQDDSYYGVCDIQKMLNDKRFTEGQINYN